MKTRFTELFDLSCPVRSAPMTTGAVRAVRPAEDVVRSITEDASEHLRLRMTQLLP